MRMKENYIVLLDYLVACGLYIEKAWESEEGFLNINLYYGAVITGIHFDHEEMCWKFRLSDKQYAVGDIIRILCIDTGAISEINRLRSYAVHSWASSSYIKRTNFFIYRSTWKKSPVLNKVERPTGDVFFYSAITGNKLISYRYESEELVLCI